jgi:hypothetical protein
VCVCLSVSVCVCVRACVRVCVCVFMRVTIACVLTAAAGRNSCHASTGISLLPAVPCVAPPELCGVYVRAVISLARLGVRGNILLGGAHSDPRWVLTASTQDTCVECDVLSRDVCAADSSQHVCVECGIDSTGYSTPSTRCEDSERTREILQSGVLRCSHSPVCPLSACVHTQPTAVSMDSATTITPSSQHLQPSKAVTAVRALALPLVSVVGSRTRSSRPLNQSHARSLSFQFLSLCQHRTNNTVCSPAQCADVDAGCSGAYKDQVDVRRVLPTFAAGSARNETPEPQSRRWIGISREFHRIEGICMHSQCEAAHA